jgi:hypothetical protein
MVALTKLFICPMRQKDHRADVQGRTKKRFVTFGARRAATSIAIPNRSPHLSTTSQDVCQCGPVGRCRFDNTCWRAIAQLTASTALPNSARTLSPAVLAIRPRYCLIRFRLPDGSEGARRRLRSIPLSDFFNRHSAVCNYGRHQIKVSENRRTS